MHVFKLTLMHCPHLAHKYQQKKTLTLMHTDACASGAAYRAPPLLGSPGEIHGRLAMTMVMPPCIFFPTRGTVEVPLLLPFPCLKGEKPVPLRNGRLPVCVVCFLKECPFG
jgi:hypothetical protein